MSANEVKNWKNEGSEVIKVQMPSYSIVDSCGVIIVPAFHGGNTRQMLTYAASLQTAILKLSKQGIKGWIIDLRQNTGGNMAPMIAGLGPLFTSKKLGSLVDVNGNHDSWYYVNGRYYWDTDTGLTIKPPVQIPSKLPVAVLTSSKTGSSGEAVVVSFIGNAKTKLIGQPTWGLTTGNGSFDLPDGSRIYLASTIMADRNNKLYRGRIEPDILIEEKEISMDDKVYDVAKRWILSQE
jgi:C-terminal processing protease CtpA/Prc